jgi:putative transposase
MCISIPPKYSVAEIMGYLKGETAIPVDRQFSGHEKNINGECFWARGCAVSKDGFELGMLHEATPTSDILFLDRN